MSNVGNAINMAILLQARGKMKIKELASELEISGKQIRNYRDYLGEARIYIDSEKGKYGGYTIQDCNNLIGLNIRQEDINTMSILNQYLEYNKYPYAKQVRNIMDRLKAVYNINSNEELAPYLVENDNNTSENEVELEKVREFNIAFITKSKIDIDYFSLKSKEVTQRIIHPYGVYQYKNDMYVAAYCERRNKVLDFKLCRIRKYKILENKFKMNKDFNWSEYRKNCIGIYKGEKNYLVKLKIEDPMSYIISEKEWVKNQKITGNDDGSIYFEATMKGLIEIKSWILSMGDMVEVIEPKELKVKIKDEINKMYKKYNI